MHTIKKLSYTCFSAVIIFGGSGCSSPLDYERPSELEAGVEKTLPFDGPSEDQKIKFDIICADPIDVDVYLAKDKNKALAKKAAVKNESLELAIPAKEGFVVSLLSTKKTTAIVKVKALGKNHDKDVPKAADPQK